MPEIWMVIAGVILLMVVWSCLSSKLKAKKRHKVREKSLPFIEDNIHTGILYNAHLSDGRCFKGVQFLGCSTTEDGQFSLSGWEGMLVLKGSNDKRVFLKQSAVRYIEEI
ncbi:hypothetical protein LX59_01025 [Azomonas agilis]|uniref:Uncharacterized protein n=1 Tax=Azomonas agilis TaxID=116849 RepID=A0A562IYY5_9GAMM|nr:hypothetical protein [Azomonas agilis]TWH76106.1 hypothetical protein LX59_01025 [Azomonas agilis]